MAEKLGEAVLELAADSSRLNRDMDAAGRSASDKMISVGKSLTKVLTPVAGAIGLAGKRAFDEWHGGLEAIRVGTGATGDKLSELEGVMERVGGRVAVPLAVVGQVVADLNTRLGLTGKPLGELSQKFLELSKITGTDVGENVASLTRLFGDWSIASEDQGATLDRLFRLSQATGVGISELARNMVQFGSPMRQLGIDFNFGAAMFAKFEKEGVAVETLMPGLRFGLKTLSGATPKTTQELKKLGISLDDPQKALTQVFKLIKDAPTDLKANALAFKVFGVRAGPDMAAAIREGRFDLEDLMQTVEKGTDTIHAATKDTETWGDKLHMIRNRVSAAVGPYGEFIAAVGGGLAALGPTLLFLGLFGKELPKLAKGLRLVGLALITPPLGIVIALAALGLALVVAYKKSATFRRIVHAAFNAVKTAAGAFVRFFTKKLPDAFKHVLSWVRSNWPKIAVFLTGPFAPLLILASDGFGIRSRLINALKKLINAAKDKARAIGRGIKNGIVGAVRGLAGALASLVKAAINGVIRLWNGLRIPGFSKTVGKGPLKVTFGWGGIDLPNIPTLHSGGIMPGPPGKEALALLEGGEEVVARDDRGARSVNVNQFFTEPPLDPFPWLRKSQFAAQAVYGG